MKFQFILAIAFAASAYASTIAQVENDIAVISSHATNLDNNINSFLDTKALSTALEIHISANTLDNAIDRGTSDVNSAPQPFSESDGNIILTDVQAIVPTISDALQKIAVSKPAFDDLPIIGFSSLVKQDLISLSASTTAFENALINAVPSDLQPSASAIKSALDAAFSTAIAAYASETAA